MSLCVAKKQATAFGKRLRELRDKAGLTQDELAGQVKMEQSSIARLERGEREPGWATVLRLADALGVTPDAFLDADA